MFEFLKIPKAETGQEGLDIESQKRLKQDRIRKNLRILALCAAGYYFFSAGLSWYKTSKILPVDADAVSAFKVTDTASYLEKAVFLIDKNTALTRGQEQNQVILRPSSQENLKLFAEAPDGRISAFVFEGEFNHSLSSSAQAMMMGLLAAAENNANKDALNEIMRKFDPISNDGDWTFESGTVKSEKAVYELEFRQGQPSKLSLEATPLPNS